MSNTTVSSRKTSVGREELISTNTRIGQAAVASATQHQTIKVAIDVHSSLFVASRQLDNATPQPPQKFTREQLLKFIGRVRLSGRGFGGLAIRCSSKMEGVAPATPPLGRRRRRSDALQTRRRPSDAHMRQHGTAESEFISAGANGR